jgi:hypothetical protein
MRYSLRMLLAVPAYIALSAAAMTQSSGLYGDLLWAASFLSIVCAALMAIYMRGEARVLAAGFLFASTLFLAYVTIGPQSPGPTTRALELVGLDSMTMAGPNRRDYTSRPRGERRCDRVVWTIGR